MSLELLEDYYSFFYIEGSSSGSSANGLLMTTRATSIIGLQRRRNLFDEEYIENGCQPIVYDKDNDNDMLEPDVHAGDDDVLYPSYPRGTAVDDTIGTYSTNYAAAAVAFIGAIILYVVLLRQKKKRQRQQQDSTTTSCATATATTMMMICYSLIWYLILFGISYGLAGINHQVVTNDYEGFDTNNFYLSRLSYCCALLSSIGFIVTILNLKQLL